VFLLEGFMRSSPSSPPWIVNIIPLITSPFCFLPFDTETLVYIVSSHIFLSAYIVRDDPLCISLSIHRLVERDDIRTL
jgi:hypothetical protein